MGSFGQVVRKYRGGESVEGGEYREKDEIDVRLYCHCMADPAYIEDDLLRPWYDGEYTKITKEEVEKRKAKHVKCKE